MEMFSTGTLQESSTVEARQKIFKVKGNTVSIDPLTAIVGNYSALLMFKQRDNNVAYLEFTVSFKPLDYTFVFEPPVQKTKDEKIILVPEPEPLVEVLKKASDMEGDRPLTPPEWQTAMQASAKTEKDGSYIRRPWRPEWQKKATMEEAAEALKIVRPEEIIDGVEVEIKIGEITRDGKIKMQFNQDLLVPDFDSKRRMLPGRNLAALEEIDVYRDLLDVKFESQGENSNYIAYTLDLTKWDERGIEIFINFTSPLNVSNGQNRDGVEFEIRNPEQFVSA